MHFPFRISIENMELVQECWPLRFRMGTVRMKQTHRNISWQMKNTKYRIINITIPVFSLISHYNQNEVNPKGAKKWKFH